MDVRVHLSVQVFFCASETSVVNVLFLSVLTDDIFSQMMERRGFGFLCPFKEEAPPSFLCFESTVSGSSTLCAGDHGPQTDQDLDVNRPSCVQ